MKEYSLLDTFFSKTCVSVCTIELCNSIHLGTNGGQPSVVKLLIFVLIFLEMKSSAFIINLRGYSFQCE